MQKNGNIISLRYFIDLDWSLDFFQQLWEIN